MRSAYLTSAAAAQFCGYTADRYANPRKAFMKAVDRNGIRKRYFGSRVRFRPEDLDAVMQHGSTGLRLKAS